MSPKLVIVPNQYNFSFTSIGFIFAMLDSKAVPMEVAAVLATDATNAVEGKCGNSPCGQTNCKTKARWPAYMPLPKAAEVWCVQQPRTLLLLARVMKRIGTAQRDFVILEDQLYKGSCFQ